MLKFFHENLLNETFIRATVDSQLTWESSIQ